MTSPTIRVMVDPTNPGQFFACCGLLELADRVWPGAQGRFESNRFEVDRGDFGSLIEKLANATLTPLDQSDKTATPVWVDAPFNIRLDWWRNRRSGAADLKVWAGTMESFRIARAMQNSIRGNLSEFVAEDVFNVGRIAYDPSDPSKKVEPYYFDARRAPNSHSRDVGFSPNDLELTTTAFPAVELLCLIGLQRCIPTRQGRDLLFDYWLWCQPLPPELVPAAAAGYLRDAESTHYRFENWYRTGQRKHKAFRSAILIPHGDDR
jgi:CRISPR-associated protein Csb3